MPTIITLASHVTTPVGLVALVVAGAILLIDRNLKSENKETHFLLRAVLVGCFLIILVYLSSEFYLRQKIASNSVYRVRVIVIGANNLPVDNAKVWSSVGGEPKTVSGGYEIDIPSASMPSDGSVVFYASGSNSYTQGETRLTLAKEHFPSMSIDLTPSQSASVRGTVEDDRGSAIGDVIVSVVGYGNEHVLTSAQGNFILPAHAGDGQTVRLHAEAKSYLSLDQYQPAGNSPAILVLHRAHAQK